MWNHLIAIAGLALLCGGWVLLQRWAARHGVGGKGLGGGCGACSCKPGECENPPRRP